ncbi:hypothetical protein LK996_09585 [Lysobacter sp. A6]|uniref:Uncharacterized protein n=1 Tax=Noviluteimonas lactosilytica TaxID=2888523 RepID=A0ABS8JI90_9GAMM|nr:hypothetical protein [Lysobacter lactosilyticus]MCC8363323.1 hypothetical protein [Lysobacter lactosilyticus]
MTKRLSDGAKLQARMMAARIEARALFPADDPRGYPTPDVRAEMQEVAALLRSAGQPHAGKPDNGRAYHCIDVMKATGMTARKAARWVLACEQWQKEWHDAVDLGADDRQRELMADFEAGLTKWAAAIDTKDAKRLHDKVIKVQAQARRGGLNQWVAFTG